MQTIGRERARKEFPLKRLKNHLNVANVLSATALFVALGGVAYAAVPKGSVGTPQLRNGAVTPAKLKNGAVTTAKLRNAAVTAAKLRNNAVLAEKIANGAVDSSKLANGSVRASALGGGVVTTAKLGNNAVSTQKLAGVAVNAEKLAPNAVATGKIQDGAISAAKLNSGLLAQRVQDVSDVPKSSETNASCPKSETDECPSGKHVIGGGARSVLGTSLEGSVTESLPFVDGGGKRTGWTATASGSAGTFAIEVVAICAQL